VQTAVAAAGVRRGITSLTADEIAIGGNRSNVPLALGTASFAVCFAAWGLIAAFAPRFRETLHLSATQAALLVAVPVLLGSLARIPVGMLADRFGGRLVFSLLMLLVSVPAYLTPMARSYHQLLFGGFFLGLAGSSVLTPRRQLLTADAEGNSRTNGTLQEPAET
jgi:nitrate/nitrite transporter NarK